MRILKGNKLCAAGGGGGAAPLEARTLRQRRRKTWLAVHEKLRWQLPLGCHDWMCVVLAGTLTPPMKQKASLACLVLPVAPVYTERSCRRCC